MVFSEIPGAILLFAGCLCAIMAVFGYLLIRRKSVLLYIAAVVASAILFMVAKRTVAITIIEYTGGKELLRSISIGFPVYKASDSQEIQLRSGGEYIYINSSNEDLVLVPVEYGFSNKDEHSAVLYNHSHLFFEDDISYYMDQLPPEQKEIKGSGEMHYWLTTLEDYFEKYPEQKEDFYGDE